MTRGDLAGVVRVRSVRERDSRLGLAQALREQRAAEQAAAGLRDTLRDTPAFGSGSIREFLAHTTHLDALGHAIAQADRDVLLARGIADAARIHWQGDRSRLRAVEMLRERRAESRRLEVARKQAAQLDDLATQRWSRRTGAMASGGRP
ncbi:flagellar export protein FliJ [Nocardioides daejeonensis]|uniref:flagellar export protein FliJ n=1 Tax=Nocardioides daejeonensis TaxID=1046556 RepID=UPI000D742211|nr:flagellar export protein FliJ [Nocardioides daejeonensis]